MKWLLLSLAFALPFLHAQEVEIIDTTGRSIRVTPVSVSADTVMVKRAGDKAPIAIPLDKLTAESVERCRKAVEKATEQAKLDAEAKLRDIRKDLFVYRASLKGGDVVIYSRAKDCVVEVAEVGSGFDLKAPDGSSITFWRLPKVETLGQLREKVTEAIETRASGFVELSRQEEYRKGVSVKEIQVERFEGFSKQDKEGSQPSLTYYLQGEGQSFWITSRMPSGSTSGAGKDLGDTEFRRVLSTIEFP
jgi:hypothetical protein